jgi:hypothetical protein
MTQPGKHPNITWVMPEDPTLDYREEASDALRETQERFNRGERGTDVQLSLLKRGIIQANAELDYKSRHGGLTKAEREQLNDNKDRLTKLHREVNASVGLGKFVKG